MLSGLKIGLQSYYSPSLLLHLSLNLEAVTLIKNGTLAVFLP